MSRTSARVKNSSSFFAEICTFHRFPFLVCHCQTTYKAFIIYLKYFKSCNSKESFSCRRQSCSQAAKIAGRRPKRKTLVIYIFKGRRTLADFFCGPRKNFNCRLVCCEFRQVCDKIGASRAISDSARSRNVLSGLVG